jgi:hypothetical protein
LSNPEAIISLFFFYTFFNLTDISNFDISFLCRDLLLHRLHLPSRLAWLILAPHMQRRGLKLKGATEPPSSSMVVMVGGPLRFQREWLTVRFEPA